jgi:ubiquinone/menaquinone biosynthesis C-methylase UbiE
MKRVVIPELLDADSGTPREVEDSLADLRMINRYFGGLRTMAALIQEVAVRGHIKTVSWLDVGGGTGDLASYSSQVLARQGIEVDPVLLDRVPGHMTTSTRGKTTPALGTTATTPAHAKTARVLGAPVNGHYPSIGGDALALPFQENSFDVVGCCLFVHHLEPQQVVQFVDQALRVARHAVLINDLIRHPLHVALAYAGYALYRSRITRHDAVASVRRAYTVGEIENMLQQTQAEKIETRRFFPFRMGVIAWKKPSTT